MNRAFLSMALMAAAVSVPITDGRKNPNYGPNYSLMEEEAEWRRRNAYEGYRDDDDRARIAAAQAKQARKAAKREADRQRARNPV